MVRVIRDIVVVLLGAWTILATTIRRPLRGAKHPSWSLPFELVVEILRMVLQLGHDRMSIPLRRLQPVAPRSARARRQVKWQRVELAGVQTEMHTPLDWQPGDPTWLYFHGGSYTMCSPATHREMISRLSMASGARCLAPDYRKAPEAPYPAAVDDGMATYRALLDDGLDPRTLVLGGDSAGGGLTLAVMLRARDEGLPLPGTSVLLSPWVDLTAHAGGSIDDNAAFDYLSGPMLRSGSHDYLCGADARDPLASPLFAELSGLPPLLVQSGSAEILLDQHCSFVERAREAGVEVVHEVTDGMVHVFQLFGPFATARRAVESIGEHVRSKTSSVGE